jgi:hypothetical protein
MTKQNDDLNQLGYVSSAPDFSMAPEATLRPEDLAELTTMQNVSRLLKNRKKYYSSVDSLSLGNDLTIENQLLVNKKVVFHIQEVESMIDATITRAKEILNGDR